MEAIIKFLFPLVIDSMEVDPEGIETTTKVTYRTYHIPVLQWIYLVIGVILVGISLLIGQTSEDDLKDFNLKNIFPFGLKRTLTVLCKPDKELIKDLFYLELLYSTEYVND